LLATVFDRLRDILISMRFADILDIIIVAAILYVVFTHLHSTSAFRIAAAIVLVLAITGLTGVARMRVLNFILSKILEIGVIALVIVFQPELRRFLEKVGAKSLHLLNTKRNDMTIDQRTVATVVSACETLAKERTGVLLVFERDFALDDYFKSGTIIDAEISSELIRNLFFTKAALHDGAVIIKNGRIAAAGCVLPLTENTGISSDLGTRHRAGIGMSEETDAVVVIVSEETGTISVATNGMLKRHLTPEMLRYLLLQELKIEEGKQNTPAWIEKSKQFISHVQKEVSRNEK